ncbi:hypothetical protein OXYTRIMIC_473 [Oxytricha trifallax]|uniref:DEAD/DEAH-box helicase domain-containing protein n=1 Tax=Oxytricha trifallax TaxID=1172189 RepID=A0A073HYI2_9SPIT|nr:hypothetical protein OXYTRIMIC_473 [Oxytricha trifallax]
MLAKRDHINLQLERLVVVLQSIKGYELDQLDQILTCDETLWMRELSKLQSCTQSLKNQSQLECKSQQIWQEFLQSYSSDHKIPLEEVLKCSLQMEESCMDYKHSTYQSTIAAIVLNHLENNIQIQMPTASGKTWVQGLLACYWIQQGKKVVILVPEKILKMQTQKFLQPLGIQLQIETIENFYITKRQYDILIVDEFDRITWKHPFYCHDGKLQGIWDIGLTRSYMFSTTCDQGIQRVLAQVCIRPKILKFKSEYEYLHELRQDQVGDVIVCSSAEDKLSKIKTEIQERGQALPYIIFCDDREKAIVKDMIEQTCKLRVKTGISLDILDEIESWQNGMLILSQDESFGYNTKFRTDAQVLIACEITSEGQYLQMRGRSSRSMGALQSKYYPVSTLPKQQILLRMKKISIERFGKLEQLVALIYKKRYSKVLIEAIADSQKDFDVIESLDDLKQLIGESAFRKLSQNLKN